MAFLFQDQNQGIRNDIGHAQSAAAATVLFHPDSNRRLRNHTESADPFSPRLEQDLRKRRSRAWVLSTLTAGGDFHPALRTSAARYERPVGNYAEWRGRQQAPCHGDSACPHSAAGMLPTTPERIQSLFRAKKLTIKAARESDSG